MKCLIPICLAIWSMGGVLKACEIKQCPKSAELLKQGNYQQAFDAADQQRCPTLRKLAHWFLLKDGHGGMTFKDYQSFLRQNPHWPLLKQIRKFGEKVLTEEQSFAELESYFHERSPQTPHGLKIYVQGLLENNQKTKAIALVRQAWHQMTLSSDKADRFLERYRAYLTEADYKRRVEHFLAKKEFEQATQALGFVTKNKTLLSVQLKLHQKADNGHDLYHQLSPHQKKDPGVVLAYFKWLQMKEDPAAYAFFKKHKALILAQGDQAWKTCYILARDSLVDGNYNRAFEYLDEFDLPSGVSYMQTQFLLGWMSLQWEEDPVEALEYLKPVYPTLKTGISQSKFAYWIGRAYEDLGKKQEATAWYKKAAVFARTYYGALACEALGHKLKLTEFYRLKYSPQDQKAVDQNELVIALRILHDLKMFQDIPPFYDSLSRVCKTQGQKQYLLHLVHEVVPRFTVDVARLFGYTYDFKEAYPRLSKPAKKHLNGQSAFIEAIIRKESGFNPLVIGAAKERGLMQIMEETAKKVCKDLGISYRPDAMLEDPAYNVRIGSAYITAMLNNYDGYKDVALAAYNAGPGNVAKWLKRYGDPRLDEIDIIDWIECIPYEGTRDYVQSILANERVYKALASN